MTEAIWQAGSSALRAGSLMLGAAAVAAWLMRNRSASARHAVWVAGLTGMGLLALLAAMPAGWQPPLAGVEVAVIRVEASTAAGMSRVPLLAGVWAAVSALLLLSLARSHALAWRMARSGRLLREAEGARVVESPRGMGPMTWGFLRPVIFLPREAEEWDKQLQDAVLRHEMAHGERGDCWWLLLGRVIASLFWFQPLAWWALHRMVVESERAADDAVLRAGVSGQSYAEWLVAIARSSRGEPDAALAMGRASEFEGRLKAVLDEGMNRRRLSRAGAMALAAGLAMVLLPVAAAQKGGEKEKEKAYRIGEGVTAPKPIFKVEPQYTQQARDAKLQGAVLLQVEIDKDGAARNVRVRRALGLGLDESAVTAVKQWKFEPGRKDGKPVRVLANIEVNFRLS